MVSLLVWITSFFLLSFSVFVLGNNGYGQLGMGRESDFSVPTLLKFDRAVDLIACGLMHSAFGSFSWCCFCFAFSVCSESFVVLVTRDGNLYTFGRNMEGQLGLGDTTDRLTPSFVSSVPKNCRIESLTLGSYHSVSNKKKKKKKGKTSF
jgi:alpha-tubulin suppressor-like RCC1 family protein